MFYYKQSRKAVRNILRQNFGSFMQNKCYYLKPEEKKKKTPKQTKTKYTGEDRRTHP